MRHVNVITAKAYKGNNQDALIASGFKSPVWGTFSQWKKLGRSVAKGAKGIKLAKYEPITKIVNGQPVEDFEVYPFTVFNVEQLAPVTVDVEEVAA